MQDFIAIALLVAILFLVPMSAYSVRRRRIQRSRSRPLANLKLMLAIALLLLCWQSQAQTNTIVPGSNGITAAPNAPVAVTANPDGTITINPTDLLSFIPAKYKSLILLCIALLPTFTRMVQAYRQGGGVNGSLASGFLGSHVAVNNEISQLKTRTGLPQTPAPSAATSAPTISPVIPLTSLPPENEPVKTQK